MKWLALAIAIVVAYLIWQRVRPSAYYPNTAPAGPPHALGGNMPGYIT